MDTGKFLCGLMIVIILLIFIGGAGACFWNCNRLSTKIEKLEEISSSEEKTKLNAIDTIMVDEKTFILAGEIQNEKSEEVKDAEAAGWISLILGMLLLGGFFVLIFGMFDDWMNS